MFLKSLVVRGFKSFADKTTLAFEPGISVVVGPNGSGKSNIVDAISWVLGEQGVRSLRGGRMEDVIFAGSRVRPALGMAEVTLTIDNSAGLLPIEFSEVEISRLLFRSGESEYRLNGAPCRLLDIQEVLSDSGVGREQHTIVGQGQLDQVLHADPQEMRAFIEEAAGVAKHRRRKERAVRKIAAAEGNLVRLGDLLAEIRRQLRPLREQAEVARRHATLEEERRRIALVLTARELAAVREGIGPAGEEDVEDAIRRAEARLSVLEDELGEGEEARSAATRAGESARETAWGLARAIEHLRSTGRLAAERGKTLRAQLEAVTGTVANEAIRRLEAERE
ncbi:MAG: AAA family ATPase, partial [Actinomycetota bacterium]